MASWVRRYEQALRQAGGCYLRPARHGDLWRLPSGDIIMIGDSKDQHAERNAWARLKRAQRQGATA